MPNTNPAGLYQPMIQHPIPATDHYILARDARIVDVAAIALPDEGTQLVAAPEVGSGLAVAADSVIYSNVGTDGATVFTHLIDQQDRFYILNNGGPLVVLPGESALEEGGPTLFLDNTWFKGLYTSLIPDGPGTVVKAYVGSANIRANGLRVEATEVKTAVQPVRITAADIPPGNVGGCLLQSSAQPGSRIWLFNFDTIAHDVVLGASNGVDSIDFARRTLAPGISFASEQATYEITTVLPPGWYYTLRVLVAFADPEGAVVTVLHTASHNQSPVRQDQGGAY